MCSSQVPYYGETGLNAGVMHMNLTRMKDFPEGGWTAANMKVFDDFKNKIKLADQDILNILFHKVTKTYSKWRIVDMFLCFCMPLTKMFPLMLNLAGVLTQ